MSGVDTTYRLAIDVGGTFTDIALYSEGAGWRTYKSNSTPDSPSEGVIRGLEGIASELELTVEQLLGSTPVIVHGTTITTNVLVTRTGARTALLTTRGFRDTLGLGKGLRDRQFDSRVPQARPLAPRGWTYAVSGRIDRNGGELEELCLDEVVKAATTMRAERIEAVAVALMFSYLCPDHERLVRKTLARELPGIDVTLSSDVSPGVRLFERTSTAVVNAYVAGALRRYLHRLAQRLTQLGFAGRLLIMQSNGGVALPEVVADHAVSTLLSGPAGGPIAAARAVARLELPNVMTIDMGGTSFEASLTRRGETIVRRGGRISDQRITTPMLDISTIGAGGGSIAWITPGGMLQVGPQSAGAVPGPACYGRSGTEATVTDASLMLGYIGPTRSSVDRLELSPTLAEDAVGRLASQLRLSPIETAAGIYTTINERMADSLRLLTVDRGHDPREFVLLASGGAGPIHGAELARALELPLVVIPSDASVFCAVGMLSTDFVHHGFRTVLGRRPPIDSEGMEAIFSELESESSELLRRAGVPAERRHFQRSADLHYEDQVHEVEMPFPPQPVSPEVVGDVLRAFHGVHLQRFGHDLDDVPIEFVNLRLKARGELDAPPSPLVSKRKSPFAVRLTRPAWFDGALTETPVYSDRHLPPEATVPGPALVELAASTIVVPPGFELSAHQSGSFLLYRHGDSLAELLARLARGDLRA